MSGSLKQFDKFLNDDKCPLKQYPNWNHREVCMCEDTWKAALKWAIQDIGYNYSDSANMIEDKIYKELEDE